MANRATFGPTETMVTAMRSRGWVGWLQDQFALSGSRYTSGGTEAIHVNVQTGDPCTRVPFAGPTCTRDWLSSTPLVWDFYRNAVNGQDQLRQRTAFALGQIFVVSSRELQGTYGFRTYQNLLLDNAFGTWRDLLRNVSRSPLMGDYLGHVNNNKVAPNENFARELLQLFSIGPCALNSDGSLEGGSCKPNYDNTVVRSYAFALTGWTYPAGGSNAGGCWPTGANCRMYNGPMVPVGNLADANELALLSGVTLPANRTPEQGLEQVLDSLMLHPSMAPFVAKQMIQLLTTSNPSPAYVNRVAGAFKSGRYTGKDGANTVTFGTGQPGDMKAMLAAVLLDQTTNPYQVDRNFGRLREPPLMFSGVLRAMNGQTDGDALGGWWGDLLQMHVFRAPSVFNFVQPDYPVSGTALDGSTFGVHSATTSLQRLNFLTTMFEWGGMAPVASVPNAIGTKVNLNAFTLDAADAGKLVDRLSYLATGRTFSPANRTAVVKAVEHWNTNTAPSNWTLRRVQTAAFLVFASPAYQTAR